MSGLKPAQILEQGQEQLGLALTSAQQQTMMDYLGLLAKWNKTHNLTAITATEDMVIQHLLDSLSVHPFVAGTRLLDIGTGAGLPGVPLAVANPNLEVTLLDSRGKKIEFLRYVKSRLGLHNIRPVHSRIEDFRPEEKFDTLTTRAVATVPELLNLSNHVFTQGCRFLCMKGPAMDDVLEQSGFEVWTTTEELVVPFLNAKRHLVILEN